MALFIVTYTKNKNGDINQVPFGKLKEAAEYYNEILSQFRESEFRRCVWLSEVIKNGYTGMKNDKS